MPKKALVVDDDIACGSSFANVLEILGYQTYRAINARDGLALYKRELPDLVLTDFQIGMDNGALLARDIRQYGKQVEATTRIVLMSGDLPKIDFSEYGIDAFHSKWDRTEKLIDAIKPENE